MDKKKQILKFLGNLDVFVASIVLVVLVVLTSLGVVMRYVMKHPFTWLEEVQLFCMVWIVFCGAGVAFRTGSHVAIEMIVDLFPKKVQRIIGYFIDLVVVLVVGYLFKQSLGFIGMLFQNGRTTNMLGIPYWLDYGIAPISYILMIVSYFYGKYIRKEEDSE